jgi:hypothetical protein
MRWYPLLFKIIGGFTGALIAFFSLFAFDFAGSVIRCNAQELKKLVWEPWTAPCPTPPGRDFFDSPNLCDQMPDCAWYFLGQNSPIPPPLLLLAFFIAIRVGFGWGYRKVRIDPSDSK